MAPSRGLRVRTHCTTLDQFVSWFEPYCSVTSFFLPTSVLSPLGAEVPFSLDLADGTPAFAGVGGVRETWSSAANRFGRPGMMVEVRRLAQDSAPILERIKQAKAAPVTNEFDVATEISAPSFDEQRRSIQTEDWDLRSAPIDKVEMVEVRAPKLPLAPPPADEDDEDDDDAAFTDDDLPTTLVQETDDSNQRGEDAYVQMAPIADALEISIPPADTQAANTARMPVYAPPPPAPIDAIAAPPIAAPLGPARRDRRWMIAIAIIVVLAVAVAVIGRFIQQT